MHDWIIGLISVISDGMFFFLRYCFDCLFECKRCMVDWIESSDTAFMKQDPRTWLYDASLAVHQRII